MTNKRKQVLHQACNDNWLEAVCGVTSSSELNFSQDQIGVTCKRCLQVNERSGPSKPARVGHLIKVGVRCLMAKSSYVDGWQIVMAITEAEATSNRVEFVVWAHSIYSGELQSGRYFNASMPSALIDAIKCFGEVR